MAEVIKDSISALHISAFYLAKGPVESSVLLRKWRDISSAVILACGV